MRETHINHFGAAEEVVIAWADDDVAAVEALAAAEAQTPRRALLKVMAMLRRGLGNDWNLMDCEGECLQQSAAGAVPSSTGESAQP